MLINSARFGQLDVFEHAVFTCPEGLPGFPEEHEFALLLNGCDDTPFAWLQSTKTQDLCFLLIDPQVIPNYSPELQVDALPDGHEAELLCIVSVRDDFAHATVNLKAPLVFDLNARVLTQFILDDSYDLRAPLLAAEATTSEEGR
jgi:flagellar assembly factor FliW